ncbi:sorting and assembly machinery component 50 homolog [Anthonomus grandis grandis]|uniref:sorting and assembly machinery component 50 homolog n=1 Tax=Anthonomus grandis grandis TaxID=2921223 RepID=UPI0021651102|nr:sorting and assembly machinery component 50 homolog [Anthonomus grandis grandis]
MGTVHAKIPNETPSNVSSFAKQTGLHEESQKEPEVKEVDLERVRVRVDKINVDGLGRTKDDIVEDCIQELFKAKDFKEVLLQSLSTRTKLEELGCFKNIGVYIDTSKGPNASPDGLEVTFDVKEFKRVTGGISTQVGNNEGSVLVGMRAPNIFGRGEKVQVEYSHGSKKTSNFNLAFIKPFRGKHRPMLKTSVFQAHSEWPSSGYKQLERGLLLDIGFNSGSLFKHNLQWEGAVRDLSTLTRSASFDVREQSGASLKSSIKHILTVDFRDEPIFPSTGSIVQLTSELAGLGGDIGFLKNEIFFQDNYSLFEDIVIQTSLMAGYISPTNNDKKVTIADRCFIGGPLSIRGFQARGVGPHVDGDSLGSSSYWAAGLHLFTPLPFRPGRGGFGDLFRTHFFVNAGNVGDFSLEKTSKSDIVQVLKENMRISYGLGVALKLGNMARLEVNYCFPYRFEKGDQTHPGVQFGIGVQFL